jgi:hypothetical protein
MVSHRIGGDFGEMLAGFLETLRQFAQGFALRRRQGSRERSVRTDSKAASCLSLSVCALVCSVFSWTSRDPRIMVLLLGIDHGSPARTLPEPGFECSHLDL